MRATMLQHSPSGLLRETDFELLPGSRCRPAVSLSCFLIPQSMRRQPVAIPQMKASDADFRPARHRDAGRISASLDMPGDG